MQILAQILALLLSMLSKEQGKELLDGVFDKIEENVKKSANTWDDTLVLPLIAKAREVLDVPDNDEPAAEPSTTE